MALELRQSLKLQQQLVMTVQLQQAINLLQLNQQEMVAEVKKEMLENPALEEIPGTTGDRVTDQERMLEAGAIASQADVVDQNNGATEAGRDWEKVLEQMGKPSQSGSAGPTRFDDLPPIEANLTRDSSLADHLVWQLNMLSCTEGENKAALAIIHNLDHRGYLDMELADIRDETGVHMDDAEGALEIVQGLDPIGCGARGLGECLAIQARLMWPEDPYVVPMLTDCIQELETRNYQGIARRLDIHLEDVIEYHKMIRTLEPWPGRPFSDTVNNYITPDIEVVNTGGEWRILQNDDGMPRLRVSPYYQKVLTDLTSSKEDRAYIRERLDSADFLIRSIYKRQRTIHKVMKSILDRQQGFFDEGPEQLRPMILQDIADEIGVHQSTVSRVTTNKYVQCPHGIFELKYFFNAGITRTDGDDLAAEAVKQKIRKLIGDEEPKKPLSDQKIVGLLGEQNITIARRTVAKYREALGILSSSQRKRMF
jgi:RNA polymerase sigma-54 factor